MSRWMQVMTVNSYDINGTMWLCVRTYVALLIFVAGEVYTTPCLYVIRHTICSKIFVFFVHQFEATLSCATIDSPIIGICGKTIKSTLKFATFNGNGYKQLIRLKFEWQLK